MPNGGENLEIPTPARRFAFDSLEAVRKRLLDITSRNRLLNYRYPRTACIRIINELPDHVARGIKSGKSFSFLPVPEPTERQLIEAGYDEYPTAEQWAKSLGFATSYELPTNGVVNDDAGNHENTNLQTLLYARELEPRLRNIRSKAEAAVEESGANILYLALGFLEWVERHDSDAPRLAPLFTLPVRLDRGSLNHHEGVYRYTITVKDEGLLTNITLQEKLKQDFELYLPNIDEDTLPEDYFATIEQSILQHQPRWRIRRHASLVMQDFAKQVMYQDLDPAHWPDHASIENHPIIKQFFSAAGDDYNAGFVTHCPEHQIDSVEQIHDSYPLVFEADSSQHSAIIDAVNGENLVIEGPPGTGKSQTISNLIAACIASGRKVLFVAEKMAALNVDKDRLDKAGLGDFCLELHSHKTNKQRILHDLKARLESQNTYRCPVDIDADIVRFEDLKTKLQDYVQLINSKWHQTGLTLHQILHKATRYREQLRLNPNSFAIEGINGEDCTQLRQKELFDQAAMLANIFEQVSQQAADGDVANHHWYGVTNTNIMGFQIEDLNERLSFWNEKLVALHDAWRDCVSTLQMGIDTNTRLGDIELFVACLDQLPSLQGDEPLDQLPAIVAQQDDFRSILDAYLQIHRKIKLLGTVLRTDTINQPSTVDTLNNSIGALTKLGVDKDRCIADLTEYHGDLQMAVAKAKQIESRFKDIVPHIPEPLLPAFAVTREGLNEFTKLVDLISQLPAELWRYRNPVFDTPDIDPVLEQLTMQLQTLVPLHHELKPYFVLDSLPSVAALRQKFSVLQRGGFLRWFSSEWRAVRRDLLSYTAMPKPNKAALLRLLPKLIEYADGMEAMHRLDQETSVLGDLYQGIDTPEERYVAMRNWYKSVRQEYGIGFGSRVTLGNALLTMERDVAIGVADEANATLSGLVRDVLNTIAEMQQHFPVYIAINNQRFNLCRDNAPLVQLVETLATHLAALCTVVHDEKAEFSKLVGAHNHAVDLHKRLLQWHASEVVNQLVPAHLNLSVEAGEYSSRTLAAGQSVLEIAQVADTMPALLTAISAQPTCAGYQAVKQWRQPLKTLVDESNAAKQSFIALGQVHYAEWTESSNDAIGSLIRRNETALGNANWLNTWIDYVRLRNKLSSDGLSRIINCLEDKQIATRNLDDVVKLAMYHQLASEVLGGCQRLAVFSGMEQEAVRERFQDYDRKLLRLQREKIAYSASRTLPLAGVGQGRIRDYTETALIRHHAGLQRPRIAVRTLITQAARAIQTLKPCFMMSPMSVAQYLEPGKFEFDLVVMDEASQIRPEDALGAIARGKSLVVVGDPKQLPPTSFFQRAITDDDGEDAVALQVSESILDSVAPMFKQRPLLWHYRSRHESLIAFSNQHFYNSNLVLFPSPFQESEEFGIRFTRISRGRFINRRNVEEAREVVQALAQHLIHNPNESVGVVAMNGEQRDEIILQLDYLTKDDFSLREARDRNERSNEPLFIKNLENVQGDERDVVFISMTYAPEQVGATTMHQRFPTINTDGGWRRLNVLFTRSKKRMHVFSSMTSGHINLGHATSKGVQSLRAWLEYCEHGHLDHIKHTGRPVDSDFEIAVITALEEHGYQSEPQLGVAGYYLDVAVRDPGQPGRFLMGIECDGATYHSAKSTRDRDRLRQEILERLGWRIRRIWSTDWFKNPQAQLQPILLELGELATEVTQLAPPEIISAVTHAGTMDANVEGDGNPDIGLRERLLTFNDKVIKARLPDTADESRLLRPEMIEALLRYKPCSTAEFAECIPSYLRFSIDPDEVDYLEPVLELVADYG